MLYVRGEAVRWVSDDQPGFVEVQFVDAHGRRWSFIDKTPVFSDRDLSAETAYPVPVVIGCKVVSTSALPEGQTVVVISTGTPWGLESTDGQSQFTVAPDQLTPGGSHQGPPGL